MATERKTNAGKRSANKGRSEGNTTSGSKPKKTAKKNSNSRTVAAQKKQAERKTEKTKIQETEVQEQTQRKKQSGISLRAEICIWITLAFCILLLLSNFFGIGGVLGQGISYLFFGIFGVMAYLMPFILFIGVCFIIVNIKTRSLWTKVGSFLLLLITLSCFCELIGAQFDQNQELLAYFETGSELHAGGGIAGGLLCRIFCPLVGVIGAWLCNIVLFLISIITISGQSAINGIYDNVKPELSMKKELGRQKRENVRLRKQAELRNKIDGIRNQNEDLLLEIKEPRRDRKAYGVSLDTTLEEKLGESDDVHQVLPGRKGGLGQKLEDPYAQGLSVAVMDRQRGKTTNAKKLVESADLEEKPPVQMEFTINRDGKTERVSGDLVSTIRPLSEKSMQEEEVPDSGAELVVTEPEIRVKKNPKSSEKEQVDNVQQVAQEIAQKKDEPKRIYEYPSTTLLGLPSGKRKGGSTDEVRETAAKLQSTLESFGVNVAVTNVSCGPAVTRYELQPDQGVKVSRIVNLADDIKLNLAAADIRIEAPIPGKAAVGIEVPNKENSAVYLRELLETEDFRESKSRLAFAVGKDIAGQAVVTDIAKMPHLLIAGATGSGKSVCINTLIMSILYKADPDDVKLIMIDPKVVELSVYNGIPHLLIPVVTDPKKASGALNWAVAEMTRRYDLFAQVHVRDLKGYNTKVEALEGICDPEKAKKLPQIVIIVDELADLMMVAPGEVEDAICRLAQLARACGIHLIIATQRPSVNVITGLIKANMPSRIAFSVTSGVDSRTILDMNGAEKLLGKGDMLFYPQGYPKPIRVQGAFVTDDEVGKVTDFLKKNYEDCFETKTETIDIDKFASSGGGGTSPADGGSERDSYFQEAGKFIIEKDKASIGMLQRVFKIGFNRAARIMDQLAEAGVVGPEEGTKPRKILMTLEEFEVFIDEYL